MAELAKISVDSLAAPGKDSLLAARAAVQTLPELQALFLEAKANKASPEALADVLFVRLSQELEGFSGDEVWNACLYLADEYAQLGDQIMLVSRETGRVTALVGDEDFYTPQPTRREFQGEALTKREQILKPEVEAKVIQWQYTESRDAQILAKLRTKIQKSGILNEGNTQLLKATRTGRVGLVDRLKAELPELLGQLTGQPQRVFDCFEVVDELPEHAAEWDTVEFETIATVKSSLEDVLALNFRHDPYVTMKRQIACQWVRALAKSVATHPLATLVEKKLEDASAEGVYVGAPEAMFYLGGLSVSEVPPTWLKKAPVLYIRNTTYDCQARELLNRWEVAAKLTCEIHFNLDGFEIHEFTNLPEEEHLTEVVG